MTEILHEYMTSGQLEGFQKRIFAIKQENTYQILFDIVALDNLTRQAEPTASSSSRYELVYIFSCLSQQSYLFLHLEIVNEEELIPTLKDIWANADWLEKECSDLMGIKFDTQVDLLSGQIHPSRFFNFAYFEGHPLRKDFVFSMNKPELALKKEAWSYSNFRPEISDIFEENTYYEFDLNNPLTKGCFRMKAQIFEKKINQLDFHLGFRHLGIEKTCESIPYKKINHYLEALNPRSPFFNSLLWVMLLEEAMKITIPQKAMAMRTIEMEIWRILDHFYLLFDQLKAVRANYLLAPLLQEIKRIVFWQDLIAGNSHHHLQFCLGGMRTEYSNEQLTASLQLVQILKLKIEQFILELSRSPLWMGHANVGLIDGPNCLSLGITGPALRAAGINHDLRKSRPYYFYSQLDFEIPLGHCGSAYDRYLILTEEIRQSLRIVSQILDHFPSGETKTYSEQEKIRNIPAGEHFLSVESPQGELAYYSVWTDKSVNPYRLKIRSPHLPLARGLKKAFIGHDIDQIPFVLASINPVWEEFER